MRQSLPLILVLLVGFVSPTQAGPKDDLGAWEVKRKAKELLDKQQGNDPDPALVNVLDDLSEAVLQPSLGTCSFSGTEDALTCKAPVEFSVSKSFDKVVTGFRSALQVPASSDRSVCVTGPSEQTQSFTLHKVGLMSFLKLIEVPRSEISPRRLSLAVLGKKTVVLSATQLGKDLYKEVRRQSDKNKGTSREGQTTVNLTLSPFPTLSPVELTLTTSEGERLNFPVELDGAKQRLKISDSSLWTVSGTSETFKFDMEKQGHLMLLGELMRSGSATVTKIQDADHFPSVRRMGKGKEYTVALLGPNSTYYGQAKYTVVPVIDVSRSSGKCDLVINVASESNKRVSLGPLSSSNWGRVGALKSIDAGELAANLGYLNGPIVNEEEGLTAKEFDRLYRRPSACATACNHAAPAAAPFISTNAEGEPVRFGAIDFSIPSCVKTCLVKRSYLSCLKKKVVKGGDRKEKYEGLQYCEARR